MIIFQLPTLFLTISCYMIPTKFPEAWEKSTMHMPKWLFYLINVISTIAVLYAAYIQIGELRPVILIVTFGGYAIVILYTQIRKRMGAVEIKDKIELE